MLKIDEKIRVKAYGDILLEVWSDYDRKKPGWIKKDLECDYIAYAFKQTMLCYILPFQQLRKAFETHGEAWERNGLQFAERGLRELEHCPLYERQQRQNPAKAAGLHCQIARAQNRGYVTYSVCVPIDCLRMAVSQAMEVAIRP